MDRRDVTVSFSARADAPKSFDEMWARALPDLEELFEREQATELDGHLLAEIDGLAGGYVPDNEALLALFGAEQFFALLQEDVPGGEWQRYLENSGSPPTGGYGLYAIVKGMVAERLVEEMQIMIDRRLDPDVAAPGVLTRPSSLSEHDRQPLPVSTGVRADGDSLGQEL